MSKKWTIVGGLTIGLILSGWLIAQSRQNLFDTNRMNRELEVMKGILDTTLKYVLQDMQDKEPVTRSTGRLAEVYFHDERIGSFYLYGQGAVFTVPAGHLYSGINRRGSVGWYGGEEDFVLAEGYEELAYLEAEELAAAAEGGDKGEKVPTVRTVDREKLKVRMEEMKERRKKEREESEKRKAEFRASLSKIQAQLVEVLANHGDSLSQLGDSEYITIIITADRSILPQPHILSVQRKAVRDYKTGSLSLDAFRAKVLQYTN